MQKSFVHTDFPEPVMVEIPPGGITLRDDRIGKVWTVRIPAFRLSRYPVTQDLYTAVMGQRPSAFAGDRLPVECVSWRDAAAFCNALSAAMGLAPCYLPEAESGDFTFVPAAGGYRLPTEAEWEYACKAGTDSPLYGPLDEIAWYKANSGGTTHAVGEKGPNAWGLYDMLGNVWEWCTDIYDETVYGSYRIFRGGGWNDEARGCLATNRRRSHPAAFRIDDLGFRLAQNLTGTAR